MRKALAATLILSATAAVAQDDEPGFFGRLFGGGETSEEDSGSFLENLIEDSLSGEGRDVRVIGFRGVLSGAATMESMTISDADGTWLTLTDVTLDWSRAALLRGRFSVAELTAGSIDLPRLPAPAESAPPSPEASGFSLPELPVSVEIGRIAADRVEIGEPVFGVETVASIDGGLRLAGGEGAANLAIDRLNGDGNVALDVAYANESGVLALDLSLEEGPNGIVANLINLPGLPSVGLSVRGEAPVTDYAADLRLATDGQDRLTGRFETETPQGDDGASLRLIADIRGDVAPVFLPEYQSFFGDDVLLETRVTTYEDGRVFLDNLNIEAAALDLSGEAEIGADGLPDRLAFDGSISDPGGGPVLLPISGPETRIDRVTLDVTFDASEDDRWSGAFQIDGLDRPGFSAETLLLDGTGQISGTVDDAAVSANLEFDATALDLGSAEAGAALGERVTGGADITWATGDPLRLTGLNVNGETYNLSGYTTVATGEDGIDAVGQVSVQASDLSVFSGVARRDLGGSIALETDFDVQPLAGFFDVNLSGDAKNLVVSQPEADRVLSGNVTLEASARRDESGLSALLETLETPNASITGQADLKSDGSTVSVTGNLADIALVLPQLDGPIDLTASADQDGGTWNWRAEGGLDGTQFAAEGLASDLMDTPAVEASGTIRADDLSKFSELAGRDLGGTIEARFSGDAVSDLSQANLILNGTVTNLITGIPQADVLMTGPVEIALDGGLADGAVAFRDTRIDGRNLQLTVDGSLAPDAGDARLAGRISSASLLLNGAPEGPLEFTAETLLEGVDWKFDVDVEGPNLSLLAEGVARDPTGPDGAVEGRVSAEAEDLSIFSELANRRLAGQFALIAEGGASFDLKNLDISASANGRGLSVAQAQADQLLSGELILNANAVRDGDAIELNTLKLSTGLLNFAASGSLGGNASSIKLDGRLANVAPFASGFSGPVTAKGTIGQNGSGADLVPDLSVTGPGGSDAVVSGSVSPDFATMNLNVEGDAPLGLINQFLQPRSIAGTVGFDISVNGPPALDSVSGVVTTSNARFVAPGIGIILEQIDGNVRLESGNANLSLAGSPQAGGRLLVEGQVGLSSPLASDIVIRLDDVALVDPRLYETSIAGEVSLNGPLQGGASIVGDLRLGETNVRIPSSSIGGAGSIPEVIHINEPPPVRSTRKRAGLIREETATEQASGPAFPLDITISAPNRLFVRGRGLDTEFSGDLRVTGTTADVVPVGGFNLVRGRFDILGQRLVIEEATITMEGSFVPVLGVLATSDVDDYTINVEIFGPAANPEFKFSSEPELPEEEVLSRLLFGSGLDTLSPFKAARLVNATRILTGQGGVDLASDIRSGTGLADLDVNTDDQGNTEVTAGAYLSEDVYTDVTVGSSGDTKINLNFDVTDTVTLQSSASNRGETSIGIIFQRDY